LHNAGEFTSFQKANFFMRNRQWQQAANEYLAVHQKQPFLRGAVLTSLMHILRHAPKDCLAESLRDRLTSLLTAAGHTVEAFSKSRSSSTYFNSPDCPAGSNDLPRILSTELRVEQTYVVNLVRRPDRFVRALREMTRHGLRVTRVDAVDALTTVDANQLWEAFRSRSLDHRTPSSTHISDQIMRRYKATLTTGVFAYILSQRKVFLDAIEKGYKRILVFDDDVLFHSMAARRLQGIIPHLPDDLKVMLLGASEYADRRSDSFREARIFSHPDLYQPIPGKTCGSFAALYDSSVFDELLAGIADADGPFDNGILGSIYFHNPGRCVAIDPALCIPDVGDSDIRPNPRAQTTQSMRMNWEIARYDEYTKPLHVTILVNNIESLRHIESMRQVLGTEIYLSVFYLSYDGIRPVIPGRLFIPLDTESLKIPADDPQQLRPAINALRVPRSDLVLLWPEARLLTEESIMNAFARAMYAANSTGSQDGTVDGILFSLDAGVVPVRGRHSIIIPAYRDVELVIPTIRSALAQDVMDFEVIVVNDNPENLQFGSRLRSMAESWGRERGIEQFARRLIVISHRRNRNGAAARNTGLYRSSGEFISFLDDDDHYEPRRLSGIEIGFKNEGRDAGASYCGYIGSWNGERNLDRFLDGDLGDHVLALRYSKHYMCTNTISFRRKSLQRICGFNESYSRHQDLELMARFFGYFSISSVPEFLVRNRPHPVPETYAADIYKLCRLKHQFLKDMRVEIFKRGKGFAKEVIEAHTRDITRRDKEMPQMAVEMVREFLASSLGMN
jgi:glycosyltransferase involved in cell wall biosynthesis/GR25 family glycosyltransferase involved in LPS biosynthesis